jgi:hypothetical protein
MTGQTTPYIAADEVKRELAGMQKIVTVLGGLSPQARGRVLRYINDRFMPVQITGTADDD